MAVSPTFADPVRVATYNVSLGRKGPGLLVRDLEKGKDKQIAAVVEIIARIAPDIILLTDFDHDYGLVALRLLVARLAVAGVDYPYYLAIQSNAGLASDLDLDGDGKTRGAGDAQGFGRFSGAQAMAILSRYPILAKDVQDYSPLLWRDLPGAVLPKKDGKPFPSAKAQRTQRLSSRGHWVVPVRLNDGRVLYLLASHPTPPVFDGDENSNGLRNRDEIRFWSLYLNGAIPDTPQLPRDALFVVLGDLNADPKDGEGAKQAIRDLLSHPRIQDPQPGSRGAGLAAAQQGGPNATQTGEPRLDTVDWDESRTPGNMRVDYVLPSTSLTVTGAGVFWPGPNDPGFDLVGPDGKTGSHHRLVWVDVR